MIPLLQIIFFISEVRNIISINEWSIYFTNENTSYENAMNLHVPVNHIYLFLKSKCCNNLFSAGLCKGKVNVVKTLRVDPYIVPKEDYERGLPMPEGLKQRFLPFGAGTAVFEYWAKLIIFGVPRKKRLPRPPGNE